MLNLFALIVLSILVVLLALYFRRYHTPDILEKERTVFNPQASWLRAGIMFCVFYLISWGSGVLGKLVSRPIVTPKQLADPTWLAWVVGLTLFIVLAYWGIWARYTLRFERKLDLLPQLAYGLLWGTAFGQMLLVFWHFATWLGAGWPTWGVWLLAYVLIGVWQFLLMDMFWDIYISPEHDNAQSIKLKVPLTHIPNVTLSLIFFALYQNYLIFVALQTLALVGCSVNLRMPAPWSTAETPAARRAPSFLFGLPHCAGYLSPDPENDPYLKAAHLTQPE